MARVAPEVHFSSAGRGHDDGARIQVSRTILHFFRAKAKALACLFLIAFTAGRITGTVVNVLNSVSLDLYGDLPIPVQVLDCFLRPLLGGLSFMPFILRYNGSGLHIFSLVGWFVLVLCSSVLELIWIVDPPRLSSLFPALIFLCWSSRVGLVLVTFLKLDALGWHRTGWVCLLAWTGWVLARLGVTIMIDIEMAGNAKYFFAWILLHACQGLISAVNGFVLLYESHAKQRLLNKMTDKKLAQTASRGVLFLRLGAFLTLLDAVYLPLVETYGYSDSENEILLSPALFLTFDNSMVLVSILILGGLIGPRDTLDQIEVMEELEHIARTQGRRIAFPGKLNRHSPHCIVSFPGKYSSEWDAAVRMVEVRSGACSLACVFLTDRDSGLGVHEDNPEEPGHCWCKALYGQVPAATYLSIVEDPGSMSAEELGFKESDAAAMGQIFLKREGQNDQQWDEDKAVAETAAKTKCEENCGRAPWGCRWFHHWKSNVEQSAALGQALHVFYFEGRVGCGKLPWQELSNETSVKEARKNSGLGASQTAEVAYLERRGHKFQEHDVAEFYDFMTSHTAI